jgi:hypothetical protein
VMPFGFTCCLFLNVCLFEVPIDTWSAFSIISFQLLFLYDCVPYAMLYLHGGFSSAGGSTLRLGAGPHATFSVLWKFLPWPLL